MTFWKWSRTAAANANADPTVNWAEGMAPGAVNDSARALMAAAAKYRDDVGGALLTGGTAAQYTLTTYQGFTSSADMDGKTIAFTPHATCTGAPRINVDGLGVKALRSSTGVELPAGALVQGSVHVATYFNATGEFIVHGFYADPSPLPPGLIAPYAGGSAPTGWLLCFGQAISRTTYAALFAAIGTQYGAGDGSTTFNIPDLRGRTVAGVDDMGGSAAGRLTSGGSGVNGTVRGAAGGAQSITLDETQMPSHRHFGTTDVESSHVHNVTLSDTFFSSLGSASGAPVLRTGTATPPSFTTGSGSPHDHTFTTGFTGGSGAHSNVQPTIILQYIIKT